MVTMQRILNLAWLKALDIWAEENKRAEELPDNEFAKAREEKAYADAEYIRELLYVVEKHEKEEQETC